MSENRLSREAKMTVEKFDSLKSIDFENGAVRDEIRSALKERESLLTPIPEDKLDEFVDKWNIKFHVHPDWIKQMLKEYEALKSEGGG